MGRAHLLELGSNFRGGELRGVEALLRSGVRQEQSEEWEAITTDPEGRRSQAGWYSEGTLQHSRVLGGNGVARGASSQRSCSVVDADCSAVRASCSAAASSVT